MPFGMKDIPLCPVPYPCKRNCPRRAFDCHGRCKEYADYRAEVDRLDGKHQRDSEVEEAISGAIKRMSRKRRL